MPRFRAKPLEFEAVQLRQPIEIRAGKGRPVVHGKPGDWLRIFDDGAQDVIASAQLEAGFERVNGAHPALIPPPTTTTTGNTASPAHRLRASEASDGKLLTMKLQYESGVRVTLIAKHLKCSTANIYAHAKKGGWKKGTRAKRHGSLGGLNEQLDRDATAKAAAAKLTQLAGRVRCPACGTMSETDPCSSCGKPLVKKW